MAELSPDDFGAYFKEIHGSTPFPWQARLLAEVTRGQGWPTLLELPTGTGKTAAIDVALFHLALDAASPPEQRKAPRRIVMVVDRRTVVDQAFDRAKTIQEALDGAKGGVLRVVADRLRSLSGTDTALALAQLRGGMPRDDAWARRPDQPLVAVSTVDQVGSRLLFRGYGVSDAMRPIHAGLLGNDALVLLDEVHLSQPFRETLTSLGVYRRWARGGLPELWQVVEMSATPGSERGLRPFDLDEADRRDPVLARRLRAKKPFELHEVKASGDKEARLASFAVACAERAEKFATPGRTVGVIVNRVATARAACAAIGKRLGDQAEVFLVTGRMRPLDRDDLDKRLGPLVRSGRRRAASARPVVVVSTQCLEAGADFDFDAIVTECASLDALRQRFGRLNRLGDIDDARGVVLVRSDALGKDDGDGDAIYGEALAKTWRWLGEQARDFGVDAMAPSLPAGEKLAKLLSSRSSHAPVMLPAHLDAWAQTRPRPRPDPDVSLWLHGVDQKQEPEVQIVWRADVSEALLDAAKDDAEVEEALLRRVEVCAPVGLEALSVPIYAARAWLRGDAVREIADVEGRAAAPEEQLDKEPRAGRRVLLWQGDESEVIEAGELPPGVTIIVPSAYGGIAEGTWDPTSSDPVLDLGDRARWQQTRRATLRLDAAVHPAWPKPPAPTGDEALDDDRAVVEAWLDDPALATADAPWLAEALAALRKRKSWRRAKVVRLGAVVSRATTPLAGASFAILARGCGGDTTTEDEGSSHTGVEVTLDDHLKGVAGWARDFAARCGLPAAVARDVELAGRWHDAGKVDPRFQRWLHGGSAYRAGVATEPLAKSAMVAGDRAARRRAFERSGYPRGGRHELASVALLEAGASLLGEAVDRDLVLHLVASHHGWCRPFAPVVEDGDPVQLDLATGSGTTVSVSSAHTLAALDSGIAERFWRLVEQYGWFGLAWLEAVLRLADHRCSEQEQGRDATEEER